MYQVTEEPDSLLLGITKIGAILGLMRLFVFVGALHEWQFERTLEKEHKLAAKEKGGPLRINEQTFEHDNIESEKLSHREFYSYSQFKKMND